MDQKKIRIKYKMRDDFRSVPVSGVWGGITPQGLINCEFFYEKNNLPDELQITVDLETGQKVDEKQVPEEPEFRSTREFIIGLSMRPETARAVGKWLLEKADEYKTVVGGGKTNGGKQSQ